MAIKTFGTTTIILTISPISVAPSASNALCIIGMMSIIDELCAFFLDDKGAGSRRDILKPIIDDMDKKVGINSLGKRIKRNKIAINEKALENLVNYYEETNDEGIFERPIFKVIEKLFDIYDNNHQPVNTNHALKNREELNKNILLGRDIFSKN